MEALGIGDLHLTDSSNSGGLSKYVQDSDLMVMNEVQKVLAYGRSKGINRVFLYGDVCDSPRMSYAAMMAFSSMLDSAEDFKFEIILGNHDMYGETPEAGHSLEILKMLHRKPNVRYHIKPRTVNIDGASVRFLPYPHTSFDKEALNIFHKEVYGSTNDAGRTMDSDGLSKSKAVVCAGHLHTAHRVRNTYYSGTLYQTNFGESLPKYFHHIEFSSPLDYEVSLIKHDPLYKLHTVVLESRADLQTIPDGKFDLVKLVIQDGADVSASDYSSIKSIVVVKNFKSKEDLAAVLTEDLYEGQQVSFKVSEFFDEWVASQDMGDQMRERVKAVRKRILNSARSG
jgi:hypothetical protein